MLELRVYPDIFRAKSCFEVEHPVAGMSFDAWLRSHPSYDPVVPPPFVAYRNLQQIVPQRFAETVFEDGDFIQVHLFPRDPATLATLSTIGTYIQYAAIAYSLYSYYSLSQQGGGSKLKDPSPIYGAN